MIPRAQIQTYRHTVDTLHLVLNALKNRQKVPSHMSLSQYLELLAIQEARKAGVEPIKAERTEDIEPPLPR